MIEIKVNNSIVSVQETEPLFSGAVGTHRCHFAFDGSWSAYGKSAVFRVGEKTITAWIDADDYCTLPWELLARANVGLEIKVGVYGVSKDAEILTSVWDSLGTVRDGSELGSDAKNPSPDIYEQVISSVQQVNENIKRYDSSIVGYIQRAESAAVASSANAKKSLENLNDTKTESASAAKSAATALGAADRSDTARDDAEQARQNAKTSETNAAKSETAAKSSETNAERSANRAQAEAERVTVPAAVGVYNVVLTDRVTNERYALIVEDGRLALLGVSADLNSVEVNLIDNTTGTAYTVAVESGRMILEEV